MKTETKLSSSEAGRKGGIATLERYGKEHFAELGRRSKPPRAPTYEVMRQRLLLEQKNKIKEVKGPPGKLAISQLKGQYKLRGRSNPILETAQAGTTQVTPRERVPAGKESGIEVTPP